MSVSKEPPSIREMFDAAHGHSDGLYPSDSPLEAYNQVAFESFLAGMDSAMKYLGISSPVDDAVSRARMRREAELKMKNQKAN